MTAPSRNEAPAPRPASQDASAQPAAGLARADGPDTGAGRARPGGLLVCVAALCGGAGATTLALLMGRACARDGGAALVCDTGGPSGGLAAHARVSSRSSLAHLSRLVAAGRPVDRRDVSAAVGERLRIIARPSEEHDAGDEGGLRRLLGDARAAHRLTVVDCAAPGAAVDRLALALATHTIRVLPASPTGLRRAEPALHAARAPTGRELIVARRDSGRPAPVRALRELADHRGAPLVLMPAIADLDDAPAALSAADVTLQAIATFLAR